MADGTSREVRWYTAAELAGLPGLPSTQRRIHSRAESESWSRRPRSRGKGWEYAFTSLPPQAQSALLLKEHRAAGDLPAPSRGRRRKRTDDEISSAWTHYEGAKQPLKDEAKRRLQAIHTIETLASNGTPLMEARQVVAAQLQREGVRGGSAASLARWQKAVEGADRKDWLPLLVPHYTGRTATADMPEEAWDIFKADWLRPEQPSATSCYDRLQRIAAVRGWALPSLRTFERRIERELPRAVRVLARQGEEALMRLYPAQERDRSVFAALEAVNSDGHRWDVMVKFPDGSIGRPSVLGFQDLYSGKILSWRLSDHESSDVVRLALADLVRNYGVPGHAYLDNGRAFASKWMTGGTPNRYRFKVREEDPVGLITALGIEVHWVTPYHGQAKPIERAWRDFCDRIAKHPAFAGAYTGNNPVNKPDNYGSKAVEWAVFERVVAEEIAAHNARVGRRTKIAAGRSFDQVFAEGYARATVRKVTDEQLRMLLLAAEAVTASSQDGSVHLAGNRYWTEALAEHAGRKVVLRVDPQHLHGSAHIYALDGSYICEAPCIHSVGFADTQAAREHARAKTQHRRAAKQMLEAERRMDAATIAAQLPETAPEKLPDAAVIEPIFRHHGPRPKPRAPQPAQQATGTDNLSPADEFITRLGQRLKDRDI